MTADHDDPETGRADRIREQVAAAPRLSASTRTRLAGLLDTADLGPRHAPVTRDPRSPAPGDMSPGPVACDVRNVASATDGDDGPNCERAQHDR